MNLSTNVRAWILRVLFGGLMLLLAGFLLFAGVFAKSCGAVITADDAEHGWHANR